MTVLVNDLESWISLVMGEGIVRYEWGLGHVIKHVSV